MRTVRTLLCLTATVASLVFATYAVRWSTRPTYGFGMYYTFSRMLLEGEGLSRAYDFDYFNEKMQGYGIATIDMPNNPPVAALPMLPLAWMPPPVAKAVWTILSVLFLLWSLKILFDVFAVKPTGNLGLGIITVVFLYRPLYDGLALGQIYVFILWLFCLGLLGISTRRNGLVSSPLAAALLLKGYGVVQLAWLFFRANVRQAVTALLLGVIVLLLSLPLFGISPWGEFFRSFMRRSASPENSQVIYQTVTGFLLHFLSFDPHWTPSPIIGLPQWIVSALGGAIDIALVIVLLKWSSFGKSTDAPLSYSASIALGVLTFPLASDYHFVMFLPLIIGLAAQFWPDRVLSGRERLVAIVFLFSVLVMASPLKYQQLQASAPLISLLAYPRLYAGIALILCFGQLMKLRRI